MRKDDLNVHVRGPFHGKDFKWKKLGDTGLISEKNGSFVRKT